jgi:hypothetical protein
MAYVMQNLPKWGSEINATLAAINALAAGGVYAIPYKFSTATADADPGPGFLRLDNATQNATTTLRLDVAGSDTVDYTTLIDTFDASTSTVKGQIRIAKQADPSKFLDFNVTARATPAGYRNISVAPIASTSATPFANNDPVMLFFQRTGDKGDTGAVASFPVIYVREEQPAGTASTTATTSGWVVCVLNTTKNNEIAGASLASNLVTLPAGTYEFEGTTIAQGIALWQKARLFNATDSTTVDVGSSEITNEGTASRTSRSFVRGKFTIAAQKQFRIERYASYSSAGNVQGFNAAVVEVYSEVIFRKVA